MKDVLPVIEEALNRLRARQMVTEIALMKLVRTLSPQARRAFAERFPVHVATLVGQQPAHVSPAIEDQVASLLTVLQQAAGDRNARG